MVIIAIPEVMMTRRRAVSIFAMSIGSSDKKPSGISTIFPKTGAAFGANSVLVAAIPNAELPIKKSTDINNRK